MYLRQPPTYHHASGDINQHKRGSRYAALDSEYGVAVDSAERTSHDFTEWERIGRGGFGKVYRARPRKAQYGAEYVAIKVVDKRGLRDSSAEQRLATEVAIHETLEHRHVVRLYESFEDDRFVYLVMEYCAGGDLWRHLRRRQQNMGSTATGEIAAVDESEARRIVGQVAAAMAYLHAGGVLHRDLKLANILLTDTGDVRVADFGLATSVGAGLAEPATVCGTPSYLAPEMLARRAYGFEADVWALGCLLLTLLTGLQPFRSLRRITDDAVARVRLPSALSHDARDLVRVLLRVDPHARIRSADILAHPFFSPAPPMRDALPRRRLLPSRGGAVSATTRAPVAEQPTAAEQPTTAQAAATDLLACFSTRRLRAPQQRALKNGTVYVRGDGVVVLDISGCTTAVALDERARAIYELARPLHKPATATLTALRTHPWDLQRVPTHVGKAARVACRCVAYLLARQKRVTLDTPQGRAALCADGSTFRLSFFNGISVELSRERAEAVVRIPARADTDLPDEIQKLPLPDFGRVGDDQDDAHVPQKVRAILRHSRDALSQTLALDEVLCRFELDNAEYDGSIEFPVQLQWNSPVSPDYLPPGLRPRHFRRRAEKPLRHAPSAVLPPRRPISAVHATASSATAVAVPPARHHSPQWGA
ncbi:hypothetical protein H4R20_006189, partial [Coemansia guatemalensis]